MKAAARPLAPEEFIATARDLVQEFGRQLTLRGLDVEVESDSGDQLRLLVQREGARHVLRFSPAPTPTTPANPPPSTSSATSSPKEPTSPSTTPKLNTKKSTASPATK